MSTIRPRAIPVGKVTAVRSGLVFASLPLVAVGDLCEISTRMDDVVWGQIHAIDGHCATIIPLDSEREVTVGNVVTAQCRAFSLDFSTNFLGRVVDCLGRPLDNVRQERAIGGSGTITPQVSSFRPRFERTRIMAVNARPVRALDRQKIASRFVTSVATIDGLCSLAIGQRVAIMAGAGSGKSTLLGMIARNAVADIVVVALVGERGREVREFLDDCLGPSGLERSVVVVATSDEPPLARQTAAQTATAIAEFYREQGLSVLLIVDSLTRVARAMRETGLAAGELPVRHGFPNSVYTALPKLLERAGPGASGWITAIYTLLTNAENDVDPLSEEVKSLLDGHIVLSESMVNLGVRPSIDPLKSVSRLSSVVESLDQRGRIAAVKRVMHRATELRQLRQVGVELTPEFLRILDLDRKIREFMNQGSHCARSVAETTAKLSALAEEGTKLGCFE